MGVSAMKRILFYAMIVTIASLGLTFGGCSNDDSSTNPVGIDTSKIYIGSLLSASGDWRDLGQSAIAAISIAISEMNDTLRARGANFRLGVRDEDTQLDPAIALQKLQYFGRDTLCFVIGPQSSAEAAAILDYANSNKITLISPSSTASSLAIPNDYLLRLSNTEGSEALAVSQKMYASGIRHIITVSTSDAGNLGLTTAAESIFGAMEGTTVNQGPRITAETNYGELAEALSALVFQLRMLYEKESIAILVNGFDEIASVLAFSKDDVTLGSVVWFAGDGVAQNSAISNSASAAQFAMKVNLRAAAFDVTSEKKVAYKHLIDTVTAMTSFAPNAYALSCYDAVKIICYAYLEKGRKATHEELKAAFISIAETYNGVTGSAKLDANGDRNDSFFGFYCVYEKQNGYYAWHEEAAK